MARWRAEALDRLPELRDDISSAETVMQLWIEILLHFEKAYTVDPPNESLIARIYAFADWCVQAPGSNDAGRDPLTAVVVSFYEHVPSCEPARDDMPRWFRLAEVASNRDIFSRHIGDEAFDELVAYMAKHQKRFWPRVPST